jgi:hypothetical protein
LFDRIKYYFLDKDGRSYYINNAGNVDKSAIPKPLELSPEGRKSVSIGYERSMTDKELGVVRSFTLPSDFVRKAGKILKSIVYAKNVGEKVYLLIQRLKVTVDLVGVLFRMQYQFLYKGEVDLTSFTDKDTRTSISVSEGGIAKLINSKDDTVYEMDLDSDPDAVLVKDDGVKLFSSINFIVTPTTPPDNVPIPIPSASDSRYLPIADTTRDGTSPGVAAFQVFDGHAGSVTDPANLNFFLETSQQVDMAISGKVKLKLTGLVNPGFRLELELLSNLRPAGINYLNPGGQIITGPPTIGGTQPTQIGSEWFIEFPFDFGFSGSANERFFLKYKFVGNQGPVPFTEIQFYQTDIVLKAGSTYKTTYVKGLKLSTLAKRIIEKITGSASNIDLTFLQKHDNFVFSSGDGIRGLAGAKVKTSLKDLKDFIWVVLAASRGIENGVLMFEQFAHFLDPSNPIQLGEVAKLNVTVAKDLLCSTVNTGYPVQQIDDVNGKYSFNNTFYFSTPLDLDQPKALSLISNYVTDAYYQEIIRLNLDGKTTTDDKSDNMVMVFNTEHQIDQFTATTVLIDTAVDGNYFSITGHADKMDLFKTKFTVTGTTSNDGTYTVAKIVQGIGVFNVYVNENIVTEVAASAQFTIDFYSLKRANYSAITGVPDTGTVYNIEELTPKRILLKHSRWINSIFYGFQGQKITFNSTEKNSDLETTLGSLTIKEKSPYEIGTDILFKPFYFDFDTIVPNTLIEDLDANINRCFSFEWYGNIYKGFLRKAGVSANDNKSQQYRLLCTPDTDVTPLIF